MPLKNSQPLCPRVGGVTSVHPHACPARRRLTGNLDDATKQALRAAARSGLKLYL